MSRPRDFESKSKQDRMRRAGYEAANPKALYYEPQQVAELARAEKLEAYLKLEPRGERDVERLLDAQTFRVDGEWVTRKQRDAWLRGVLDADKD